MPELDHKDYMNYMYGVLKVTMDEERKKREAFDKELNVLTSEKVDDRWIDLVREIGKEQAIRMKYIKGKNDLTASVTLNGILAERAEQIRGLLK